MTNRKTFVEDWTGKCLEGVGFISQENVPMTKHVKKGTALLCCPKLETQCFEIQFDVCGAYIPARLFQK